MERFDFSDPQGGKGEADRQAATIKGHIGIYLNEGHDVNSPAQMKEAIESYGGIPGVSVKYVKIPELSSNNPMIKWDGISTLNNFQFHPSGVQVCKAYKIGPGKLFPWSDIQCDSSSSCPLEVLESPVQTQRSCFRVVRARQDQTSTGCKGFSSSSFSFSPISLIRREIQQNKYHNIFTWSSRHLCVLFISAFTPSL